MADLLLRVGDVLRDHHEDGPPVPIGRIVLVRASDNLVMVSPFPQKDKRGYRRNYFRSPKSFAYDVLCQDLQGLDPKRSTIAFVTPSHWLLLSEQMTPRAAASITSRRTRSKLDRWEVKAQAAYERIRPFVEGRSIEEILLDKTFSNWPGQRAKELGFPSALEVQRDLNKYIFGLGLRAALRPFYTQCGAPGKTKESAQKTGRPNRAATRGLVEHEGQNCDEYARHAFMQGWAKYKKPRVSDEQAFRKTLEEWFAESERWEGGEHICDIKPEALRYTIHQFRYWGQQGKDALTARQIERGETPSKRQHLRRMNPKRGRTTSINSSATIDSTPTDVVLVSAASRQVPLKAPWRTEVVGDAVNYIWGHHVSFESPSNRTALLAVLHAAEDKVAYCARFGIKIEPSEWHAMTFHRVIADNGEFKGDLVFDQIQDMETGAHYGAAYDAINKPAGESNHQATHRALDHTLPGATFGQRPERGEPTAVQTARLTYHEYMPELIRHVLHHNNVEKVPDLLTLEMRRDGVEPTRRGIVEWMLRQGYVSSVPADLTSLRVRCLPRFRGVLHADGVHVFDPWSEQDRLLKGLLYRSEGLISSGALEQAARRAKRIEVFLNPNDLSEAWINLEGLQQLQMITLDPEMRDVTLFDWYCIDDDDSLQGFLHKANDIKKAIETTSRRNAIENNANRELVSEVKGRGKTSKREAASDRRYKTSVENAAMTGHIPPETRGTPKAGKDVSPSRRRSRNEGDMQLTSPLTPHGSSPHLDSLIDELDDF